MCRKHCCEIQPSSHVNFAVFSDFCGSDWSCERLLTFPSECEINDLFLLMLIPPFIQQMEM